MRYNLLLSDVAVYTAAFHPYGQSTKGQARTRARSGLSLASVHTKSNNSWTAGFLLSFRHISL